MLPDAVWDYLLPTYLSSLLKSSKFSVACKICTFYISLSVFSILSFMIFHKIKKGYQHYQEDRYERGLVPGKNQIPLRSI